MIPQAPPALADTFALILDGLCRAVAARAARNPAAVPLFLLLWGRLRRLSVRFASLVMRTRAGQLRAAPSAPRTARPHRAPLSPRPRPPVGFAWLLACVPEAAAFASQLRHLLAQPEAAALLGAAPQAGRLLRPLCRMLGIEPPAGDRPAKKPANRRSSAGEPSEAIVGETPHLPGSLLLAGRHRLLPT